MENDAMALSGNVTSTSKSQSGRWRISIAFDFREDEHEKRAMFDKMFSNPPQSVAVALLTNEAAIEDMQIKGPYGKEAKLLRLSSFFRTPAVWEAIGTNDDFENWVRKQKKCDVCGSTINIECAHVRRVSSGAGTGIKPKYSAIPICHNCHQIQHQQGESAIGGRDRLDKLRIDTVVNWGWQTLKETLGFEHWSHIHPDILIEWAIRNNVDKFLQNGGAHNEK